ncbi:MAG: CoA-binding protein [Acidimicrobiia bacterium]|nr:CoA-binding protein [Acidimicrobiia bacterium]
MPHQNPTHDQIRQILADARTIALVGATSNPDKAAHGIMRKLLSAGYTVFPVNPRETEVLGQKAYASLRDIPENVDIVDVFRRAEDTPPIAAEAVGIGAKVFWLQSGITSAEAAVLAETGGLTVVMDACIGSMHAVLNVPPRTDASS